MKKNNSKARQIAFYGVISALMFVFLLIETYLFAFAFGNFTPAILTLPFAIALSLYNEKSKAWLGGTVFGCCSFFLAIIIANAVFINPLISILPRVLIGVVAYFVYWIFSKVFKNVKNNFVKNVLPFSIAGVFGVLTNTVFTITAMWAFDVTGLSSVMTVIISFNFLAEVIGAAILLPIYIKTLKRVEKRL